ncbi:hypothetical protein AVEN_273057-1 [Araneus ventricosus]|uniref:Uncharacterized protein n=1 Tax=Araneus ventricosus TaxID=182803 RepID=A0A4Y2W9M6_ARAVE|nr:hypothetical protein AVEN_273057-1 [Araneus ventricosus]
MTIVPLSGGAEPWLVEAVRTPTSRRLVFNLPLMPTQGGVAFLLRLSTKQPSSSGHHEYVDEKLPVKNTNKNFKLPNLGQKYQKRHHLCSFPSLEMFPFKFDSPRTFSVKQDLEQTRFSSNPPNGPTPN